MIKNLLLMLNVAILVILNALLGGDVTIKQNLPAKADPGSEFTYTLDVKKGDITGFAKVQQELPAGFTAENVDSKGASFTFSEGKVKMIWMTLPGDAEFTITYKVKVDATVSGSFDIDGKFSYLDNNERKAISIPTAKIEVGGSAATASDNGAANSGGDDPESQESVLCSRTITSESDGKFKVSIEVKKGGVTGFAKIQDILPEGLTASEDNKSGAVFSFVNQKAKFVWMGIPEDETFQISYLVSGGSSSDFEKITGEFSFLQNNETQKVPINTTSGALASNESNTNNTNNAENANTNTSNETNTNSNNSTNTSENNVNNTSSGNETADNTAAQEEAKRKAEEEARAKKAAEEEAKKKAADQEAKRKADEAAASKAKNDKMLAEQKRKDEEQAKKQTKMNNTSSTPAPENGVTYRVQVSAGHEMVDNNYFKKVHSFDEESVKNENHEGWIKYTIGSFKQYSGSKQRRNGLDESYDFPGPFVTAYNNGGRITVQEALMITNQKWVK